MTSRTGFIVFARLSSQRLPRKSLATIAGQPLITFVLNRASRINRDGMTVLATSDQAGDDDLADAAHAQGVIVFRGALDDVAGRAIACCHAFGFDRFARICGDRPFFDPRMVDTLLDLQRSEDLDLATNFAEKTFPAGLAAEVVKLSALERAMTGSVDDEDREHVTRAFYRQPSMFRIGNVRSLTPEDRELSLAVDTPEDLDRARWIVEQCAESPHLVPVETLVNLTRQWQRSRQGASNPDGANRGRPD